MLLEAVNCDGIGRYEKVTMLWSSLVWITSLTGVHVTTKRNVVACVLGCVLLVVQRGVFSLRRCTSEPAEHFFGTARQKKREFSVADLVVYERQLHCFITKAVECGILDGTNRKGYRSTFDSFMASFQDNTDSMEAHGVDVDYTKNVPDQLESTVIA
jgi:hypothetical protein